MHTLTIEVEHVKVLGEMLSLILSDIFRMCTLISGCEFGILSGVVVPPLGFALFVCGHPLCI